MSFEVVFRNIEENWLTWREYLEADNGLVWLKKRVIIIKYAFRADNEFFIWAETYCVYFLVTTRAGHEFLTVFRIIIPRLWSGGGSFIWIVLEGYHVIISVVALSDTLKLANAKFIIQIDYFAIIDVILL